MFKLADGRTCLFQWDINRKVIVEDDTITQVHFCNKTDDCSLVVDVKEDELFADAKLFMRVRYADIPNILLQEAFPIRVYAYCSDYTKVEELFKVRERTKPSDYAYTETEVRSYDYLENKLDEIEAKGFSTETVSTAVNSYFDANPIGVVMTDDGQGNVELSVETIPNAEEVYY